MKTGNCLTLIVFLIVTVTLSHCERDKNTLTNPVFLNGNNIIITLNKSEYKSKDYAELTIFNLSNNDILLGNCGFTPGFDFEKKINGEWLKLFDLICAKIYLPYLIKGGSSYKFSVDLLSYENLTKHSSGPYRLKLWLTQRVGKKRVFLEDTKRVTPEFYIITN